MPMGGVLSSTQFVSAPFLFADIKFDASECLYKRSIDFALLPNP